MRHPAPPAFPPGRASFHGRSAAGRGAMAAATALALGACATAPARPGAAGGPAPGALLEAVGDVAVVAVEPEGFDALAREERLLACHLGQAAMAGHRIALMQGHRRNRAIWDLVEGLHSRREVLDPSFAVLLDDYRRRLFLHGGVHDAVTQEKFVPLFGPEELLRETARAVAAGARLGAGVAVADLTADIFDPEVDRFRVRKSPGPAGDALKAGSVNHYDAGLGVFELEGLRDAFPRNSRVAQVEGRLVEQPYRAGAPGVEPGLAAGELAAVAVHLDDAAELAPPEQRESIRQLALFLRTGAEAHMLEHDALWTPHAFPVDYALGFLDTRADPRGLKGLWSGLVALRDPLRDVQLRQAAALAGFFEERLPWPAAWRRPPEAVRPPAASAVRLLAAAGAAVAFPPSGLTLPPEPQRAQVGSKSWVVLSALEARERLLGDRLVREFVFPDAGLEAARCWRAVELARVAAREILGRPAGRLPIGAPDPRLSLAPLAGVVEEARAEALALLFLDDRRAVVAGLLPDAGCQAVVATLAAAEFLTALAAVPRGEAAEDDRVRALLLLQGWLAEKDAVRVVRRGASRYAHVTGRDAWRAGLTSFAEALQRARAEGDGRLVRLLVDQHAARLDVGLRDEVAARLRHLGLPGRLAALPPVLEPVRDGAGRVVDATARAARSVDDLIAAFERVWEEAAPR